MYTNYQCNKCKGKHNILICQGPRKLDPNTKKDSNLVPITQDSEMLTTVNESKHSTLLQTAYSKVFNNKLSLSSTAQIMFDSGSQKSYITADLKKKLHLKTICNEKIVIKTFGSTEGKVSIVDVVNLKITSLLILKLCVCPLFVIHFWDKSLLKFPKFILNLENYILLIINQTLKRKTLVFLSD